MNLKTRSARAFKNFVNILVVVYKTTLENLQDFAQSENGNPSGKSSNAPFSRFAERKDPAPFKTANISRATHEILRRNGSSFLF